MAADGRVGWRGILDPRRAGWLRLLLVFMPVAVGLNLAGAPPLWRFLAAALAIIPLAGLMGEATEQLACKLGPGIGGLLNATFGNAAELIIALFALFRGLDGVVKASVTGSILGNLLLVLGASLLAGGLKHSVQRFSRIAAGMGGTLLTLGAMGLLVPALFHHLVDPRRDSAVEHKLSVAVSIVLVVSYALSLVFTLVTHRDLVSPSSDTPTPVEEDWGVRRATAVLLGATVLVGWSSEILVSAVEATSRTIGMTEVFVGVVVVAVVGNAAEHSTAVLMAMKNQMDLAVGIALGSALQVALLVAPVLVFASYLRPHPMDLLFSPLEIVAVIMGVLIARMVAEDGESNWFEGAMLLMVYAILALAIFFLPEHVVRERREAEQGKHPIVRPVGVGK